MIGRMLLRWILLTISLAGTAALLPGVQVSGGVWPVLWTAALFALVNVLIGTLLRIITLPLMLLTLGLFTIVVNAVVLWLTDVLTDSLEVDGFWAGLFGALCITVLAAILHLLVREPLRRRD